MYRFALVVVLSLADVPTNGQAPDGSEESAIEEVLVVGTRRASRDVQGLAVPVDVLDAEQLNTQGDGDILDTLASPVPSFNVSRGVAGRFGRESSLAYIDLAVDLSCSGRGEPVAVQTVSE